MRLKGGWRERSCSNMNFPCTGCGCCCKRINLAVAFEGFKPKGHPLHFPYSWSQEGVCEMLTPDNKCRVYDCRPLICNIEKYAEYLGVDLEHFFKLNADACNRLMDLDNVPLQFRINNK